MTKYIFVTGGVVSGLGKGIVAASLGRLLTLRGLRVAAQKLDPYMNIDPGTMNPTQHGEVFVTDDGAETDLDLGHYERFIDTNLTKYSNLTSGKVYWSVLNKERQGKYLGETVQIIPHVTNEIKYFIRKNAQKSNADIVITEIGGTIGDIESQPFLEAIRQFSTEVGRNNCLFIHVCLVPYISGSDEYKSKPAQHSVKELQAMGIAPNIIVTRSDGDCGDDIRRKIALFCNVKEDCVISNTTVDCLYKAPIMLHENGLDDVVCRELGIKARLYITPWKKLVKDIDSRKGRVTIALVGKYVKLHDSYLSVIEALNHASFGNRVFVDIKWVDSEPLNNDNVAEDWNALKGELMYVLQEESQLNEIVRLVGVDALGAKDRLTMETAKSIREDYLHQNAFHEVDTYTSLTKQYKMMKLILGFYHEATAALGDGVELNDLLKLPVREQIGRAKYVEEAHLDRLDEIQRNIKKEINSLKGESAQ